VDFLEYLFLIEDLELESKYDAYKREKGGAFKMSIDEIRRIHYTGVGREEGIEKGIEKGVEKEKEENRQQNAQRVIRLLKKRFEKLDNGLEEKITNASSEKLNLINDEILDINDLTEVERMLK
jgi:transcription termination factor NusB